MQKLYVYVYVASIAVGAAISDDFPGCFAAARKAPKIWEAAKDRHFLRIGSKEDAFEWNFSELGQAFKQCCDVTGSPPRQQTLN